MKRRSLALTGALVIGGLLAWASLRSPQPAPGEPASGQYLTIFLIDGLSQARFSALRAAGRLPHISRLVREGTVVENGISAFPSMTGYGFYPFVTARDAAGSGLLGLRWFDRKRPRGQIRNYVGRSNVWMNVDLQASPPTMFERVAPQHTFSINALVDRGVRHKVISGWDFTVAKYQRHWWVPKLLRQLPWLGERLAPDLAEAERRVLARAVEDLANHPKIQWITFTSPDAHAHINGMDAGYDALLAHVDALIGDYRAAAAERGLERQRIYTVLTDHGLVNVAANVDLRDALHAQGVRVDREEATRVFDAGLDDDLTSRLEATDVLLLVNGNSLNYLYVRDPAGAVTTQGMKSRLPNETLHAYPRNGRTVDLVQTILDVDGVDMVVSRAADGRVIVESAHGRGTITAHPEGYVYAASGEDPLGYQRSQGTQALIDGLPHPPREWLHASANGEYPDAPERLKRLLERDDCGDIVVLARDGYDLAADYERFVSNYRGAHGGLRAAELRVPYVLSGAGVRRGARVFTARAEDVGATLFALLGLSLPPEAEGQVIEAALDR